MSKLLVSPVLQIPWLLPVRFLRGGVSVPFKRKQKPAKRIEQPRNEFIGSNEGINHRLKVFDANEIDEYFDPDLLDDNEIDSSKFGAAYKDNLKEMSRVHEKKHLFNVWRKHFKQPVLPNMLTYQEKEHIRHLHDNDPDLWTVEKLSQSFPATPAIIKKILRSRWKPKSVQQLLSHNKKVEENWQLFKKNQLEIPEDVRRHLYKFSNRTVKNLTEDELKQFIPKKSSIVPKATEFGKIIREFHEKKGLLNAEERHQETEQEVEDNMEEKLIRGSTTGYKKIVTLETYRASLNDNGRLSELEDIIVNSGEPPKTNEQTTRYVSVDAYSENTRVVSLENDTSINCSDDYYPLRINIPDKEWKEGMIYKVSDRFYNDEGNFLYRVPGLKS